MGILVILLLTSLPLDDWVYPGLEWLEVKGVVVMPNIRPYPNILVRETLQDAVPKTGPDSSLIEGLLRFVSRRGAINPFFWAAVDSGYQPGVEIFFGPECSIPGGRIEITGDLRLSCLNGLDSSRFDARPWRNFVLELRGGFLRFDRAGFSFGFGKEEVHYGPGRTGGLLLSSNPFGLERVEIRMDKGAISFQGFFSSLEPDRYLSCHRLDWVRPSLKLGITEAVLFSGSIPWGYLNPFFPYYGVQHNLYRDDNLMWGLDGSLFLGPLKLYGELLIDDFMYEPTPAPNKLGWILGGYLAEPFNLSGLGLCAEYVRLDKWVYTQRLAQNRWVKGDRVLGHHLGPDADLWSIGLERWLKMGRLGIELCLSRHGEGRVEIPYEEERGDPNPKFPSGVVESRTTPKLSFNGWWGYRFRLSSELGWEFIKNEGNRSGTSRTGPVLSLKVDLII